MLNNPYLRGGDLNAEGASQCDFVLMLLAACRDMPEDQRTVCTREMVRGFRDACDEADEAVTGGQTVLNPWPILGGVATSDGGNRYRKEIRGKGILTTEEAKTVMHDTACSMA